MRSRLLLYAMVAVALAVGLWYFFLPERTAIANDPAPPNVETGEAD